MNASMSEYASEFKLIKDLSTARDSAKLHLESRSKQCCP